MRRRASRQGVAICGPRKPDAAAWTVGGEGMAAETWATGIVALQSWEETGSGAGFCGSRRNGRFEVRDGGVAGLSPTTSDGRHLRCPVMVVGRDDPDRGAGRLLGDAFDRAFSAARHR